MDKKKSFGPGFQGRQSGKVVALVVFVCIYSYQLFNGLIAIIGPIRFLIDVFLFFIFPVVLLYLLAEVDPVFKGRLHSELKPVPYNHLALLLICGLAFAYVQMFFLSRFPEWSGNPGFNFGVASSGLLGVVYLAVTAGLIEELLYKTLLNFVLPEKLSVLNFSLVSGGLFWIAHLEHGAMQSSLSVFLYGLPSAFYYKRAENVFGLIVMHVVVDIVLFGWLWAWAN